MNVTSETDIDGEWMEMLDSSSTVNLFDLSVDASPGRERIILRRLLQHASDLKIS
jgi:hypothetical protein